MRLLTVGSISGHMISAAKAAVKNGIKVSNVDSIQKAKNILHSGEFDAILANTELDIQSLVSEVKKEKISIPVMCCGNNHKSEDLTALGVEQLPNDPKLMADVFYSIGAANKKTELIFQDPEMAKIISLAERIATTEATVLITGESGTGKELIARFIHEKSKRATRSWVTVNCAAIPEALLESEFFGHEKGSFTGAISRRIGKFEVASGSTLLLDEISEIHPHLQAKLLRTIQEREICRVGSNQPINIDVRILVTSNKNLFEEVKKGNFRDDLYYRLNVVNLDLPPLRQRLLDIEELANFFCKKYSSYNGLQCKKFAKSAIDKLLCHNWPGNVRELENAIHRAVILSDKNEISCDDIVFSCNTCVQEFSEQTVAGMEKNLIMKTLERSFGNRTNAAKALDISTRTLRNKLVQYSALDKKEH